jgi:hypothetical protein
MAGAGHVKATAMSQPDQDPSIVEYANTQGTSFGWTVYDLAFLFVRALAVY